MFYLPSSPFLAPAFDFITFAFVTALLLLSTLSLSFIFYLCVKSRTSRHLQRFNSLWVVRFIFVLFVTLWAINELVRLPFYEWRYLFPFLPNLSLSQQNDICKLQAVLSLGLFEPGFLITLLFLVNVSVKKSTPPCSWAIAFVFVSCLPVLMFQLFFVIFSGLEFELPEILRRSSVLVKNPIGEETVLCALPFLGTVVFGVFGLVYWLAFLLSCYKVLSLVINKALRVRIYVLAVTVLIALPVKILFLGLSFLWGAEKDAFVILAMAVFMTTMFSAAVGEGILVIRPIADSLVAGGECWQWSLSLTSSLNIRSRRNSDDFADNPEESIV